MPWIAFGILLVIILILSGVVFNLKRKINKVRFQDRMMDLDNTYPGKILKTKKLRDGIFEKESVVDDDFSSDPQPDTGSVKAYSSPRYFNPGNTGNAGPRNIPLSSANDPQLTAPSNTACATDSALYSNIPTTYQNY